MAIIHVIWTSAIAISPTGMQTFFNRVAGIHFAQPIVIITQPSLVNAITVIICAGIVGAIVGFIFSNLRNLIMPKAK